MIRGSSSRAQNDELVANSHWKMVVWLRSHSFPLRGDLSIYDQSCTRSAPLRTSIVYLSLPVSLVPKTLSFNNDVHLRHSACSTFPYDYSHRNPTIIVALNSVFFGSIDWLHCSLSLHLRYPIVIDVRSGQDFV